MIRWLLLALLLAGCTVVTPTRDGDGRAAVLIECGPGILRACHERAARECPNGYAVVRETSNQNLNALTVRCQ